MALLTQDLIRQVQWGQGHLWDVLFRDNPGVPTVSAVPSPFDEWFPAQDVEDPHADVESLTLEAAQATFKFPRSQAQQVLKLTFVDNAAHDLLQFFEDWIETDIMNGGDHVSTLNESIKLVQLFKLDSSRASIDDRIKSYWVYPEGPLVYHGSSNADPLSYTVNLVKAIKV